MGVGLLLALALAGTADVPERPPPEARWRKSIRAELSVATGWSDRAFVAAGGRAAVRFEPIVLSLNAVGVPSPGTRQESLVGLFTAGGGIASDLGPWEAEVSLLAGLHVHRFPDRFGVGPADHRAPAIGARIGATRRLESWRGTLLPALALSATCAWSGHAENRFRGADTPGVVAFISIGLAFGAGVR